MTIVLDSTEKILELEIGSDVQVDWLVEYYAVDSVSGPGPTGWGAGPADSPWIPSSTRVDDSDTLATTGTAVVAPPPESSSIKHRVTKVWAWNRDGAASVETRFKVTIGAVDYWIGPAYVLGPGEMLLYVEGVGFVRLDSAQASAIGTPPGGDNLGNHTATTDLDMAGFDILNPGLVDGVDVSALGATVAGHVANASNPHAVTKSQVGLGNVTDDAQLPLAGGTMAGPIDMAGNAIVDPGDVDGVDVSALETTVGSHLVDTANPHAVTTTQIGAVPTSRTITAGTGLTGGGDLSANRTLAVAADGVSNTLLANMAANTLKANATGSTADPGDFAVGTNAVVGRVGGNLVAAQLATAQIANAAVTDAKVSNRLACSVFGRSGNSGGVGADIQAASNDGVLMRVSDALGFQRLTQGLVHARHQQPILGGNVTDALFHTATGGTSGSTWVNDANMAHGVGHQVLTSGGTSGWAALFSYAYAWNCQVKDGSQIKARFRVAAVGGTASQFRIGFARSRDNTAPPTDWSVLDYTKATSANLRLRCRTASGTEAITTTGTAVADVEYSLTITFSGTTAIFEVNGTVLGTVTSGVPIGVAGVLFAMFEATSAWSGIDVEQLKYIPPYSAS